MSMNFWWHLKSSEIGTINNNPHLPDECALSDDKGTLQEMRIRFEQLCRNGWYGEEWKKRALGRGSWITICE